MIRGAVGAVAQHLDHPATSNRATGTVIHHPLQLTLQGLHAGDAAFDRNQLRPGDGIDLGAGLAGAVAQAQEVADRVQRKAEFVGVADEGHAVLHGAGIKPLVARRAISIGQYAICY